MKKHAVLLLLVLFTSLGFTQNTISLQISSLHPEENAFIHTIGYDSLHTNFNAVNQTLVAFEEQLKHHGYFSFTKKTLSSVPALHYEYQLGKKITTLVVNTSLLDDDIKDLLNLRDAVLYLPITEVKPNIQQTLNLLERKGYGTSTLQFTDYELRNDSLFAHIQIDLAKRRTLDRIEIVSTDKIPIALIQTSLKKELHQTYSEQSLERIQEKISAFDFIESYKPPETLLAQDSTFVYLYINKKNNNQFDGYIGFNNDEDGKLKLNGNLDLRLNNLLQKGEAFELMWKNNGNKQSDFRFSAEIPYLFRTPFALKGALDIQKQDSTFQNTTLEIHVGYYLNHRNKVFVGYQTQSSATLEETAVLQNYDTKYATTTYDYRQRHPNRPLFPTDHEIYFKVGTGQRTTALESNKQSFIELVASKNFEVSPTQLFYLQWNTYYLKSDRYYFNELKRFGGSKTLRGFQENSLTAKAYSIVNTEYRFLLGSNVSLYSILDYAYTQNPLTEKNNHLYAVGFGLGMLTKNSRFQIAFANGKLPQEKMKFENTTIHLSMSTFF